MLDEFERAAAGIAYREPRSTVISNLTGKPATASELRTASYWRAHARQPVRFSAGIQALRALGCKIFVEVGPTPVLSGMARRITTDPDCRWLPTLRSGRSDWEQMLETLAELYTAGVPIDWKSFDRDYPRQKLALPSYPFERIRYWPDIPSRKNSRAAQAAGESAETFRDWLYEPEWSPLPPEAAAPLPPGRWLLWCDGTAASRELAARLRERGDECLVVVPGSGFESVGEGEFRVRLENRADLLQVLKAFRGSNPAACRSAIFLCGEDTVIGDRSSLPAVQAAIEQACRGALALIQAILESGGLGGASLTFVTQGAQALNSHAQPQPAQTALWGLAGVVAAEHPSLRCHRIDLAVDAAADFSTILMDELLRPGQGGSQIALSATGRYALRLRPAAARDLCYPAARLRPDATYLITGGLSGLGLETAGWMIRHGAMNLVLAGRRPPGDLARARIDAWSRDGVEVIPLQADIGDPADAARVFSTMEGLANPLRGVIHCAGALEDATLPEQDWPRFQRVLGAKADGAWNLHLHTLSIPLDFFVLYSSGVSLLGSIGQANYAAANAFLDGLALYRKSRNLPALSINWGAWRETGMSLHSGAIPRFERSGIKTIDNAGGFAALECLLASGISRAAVLPIDWTKFPGGSGLFAGVSENAPPPSVDDSVAAGMLWEKRIHSAAPGRLRTVLQEMVTLEARKILGLKPSHVIDPRQPLHELGLDSLMALQFRNTLAAFAGLELPPTLLFLYPSVDQLADHLEACLTALPAAGREGEISPAEPGIDLDALSEEELVRLLEEQIDMA